MWWGWDWPDDLEEAQERRFTNREVLARLWPYLRKQGTTVALATVLVLLVTAATLAGPQILRLVVNSAVAGGTASSILGLAGLLLAIIVVTFALNYWLTIVVSRAGLTVITELKASVFRHVLHLPMRFFQHHPPGRLIARVESDGESLKQLFSVASVRIFESMILFFGVIVVMLATDWKMTLAVLVIVPPLLLLTWWFVRFIRRYHRESRRRYADVVSFITEYVQGVDVLQHYGYERPTQARLAARNDAKIRIEVRRELIGYALIGLYRVAEILATAAVLAVGARRLLRGELDIGTLVMFIEYIRQVFLPIQTLSEFVTQVQHSLVSGERVFGLLGPLRGDRRPKR